MLRAGTKHIRNSAIVILCMLLIGVSFAVSAANRTPIASAETQFVETSASGMQIVPASCPSYPHYGLECTGQPPQPGNGQCVIYPSEYSVGPGEPVTLNWAVSDWVLASPDSGRINSNETRSYPPIRIEWGRVYSTDVGNITPIAYSGSFTHTPSSSTFGTTYGLNVDYGCVTGPYGFPQCNSTACYTQPVTMRTCPKGQHPVWKYDDGTLVNTTPSNNPYPSGYSGNPQNTTMLCYCDATNQAPVNGQCGTQCPVGQILGANGQCITPPQCTTSNYCDGTDLWQANSCTGNSFVASCTYGCSPAGCLLPQPRGNIEVSPALIRSGETTTVTWETDDVTSCTVSENNPEITDASTLEDGSFTSSPIRMQTRYMLSCTGVDGEPFTDSAIVNVIPEFEEQ